MRTLITFSLLLFLSSCNNDKKTVTQNLVTDTSTSASSKDKPSKDIQPDNPPPAEDAVIGECYMRTSGRDTVALHYDQSGSIITGKMVFDNYQIDGSSGPVKGTVNGDVIELWYDFKPEGQRAVRQLFFKKSDDRLLWGKGIQEVRGDSTLYKDVSAITYSEHLFMRKMDCGVVKAVQ